eukprot:m.15495 g.15495  ORF g.15495 m.15495 type:complete len:66 (+) comp5028_c0_seq1:146-343(+)
MARGNQRELARAKNAKKHGASTGGKVKDPEREKLTPAQQREFDKKKLEEKKRKKAEAAAAVAASK